MASQRAKVREGYRPSPSSDYALSLLQETFHQNNFHARIYFVFLDERCDETPLMASFINPTTCGELKALLFAVQYGFPAPKPQVNYPKDSSAEEPRALPTSPSPGLHQETPLFVAHGQMNYVRLLLPYNSSEVRAKYPLCSPLHKTKKGHEL